LNRKVKSMVTRGEVATMGRTMTLGVVRRAIW
jgi:hypothetical protein